MRSKRQSHSGEPDNGVEQKTPKGYPIPKRPREDVLRDFRKVAVPPPDRGQKNA